MGVALVKLAIAVMGSANETVSVTPAITWSGPGVHPANAYPILGTAVRTSGTPAGYHCGPREPIWAPFKRIWPGTPPQETLPQLLVTDTVSAKERSEEHTSELQSLRHL